MRKASIELNCARAVMVYIDAMMNVQPIDRVVFMDELLALVKEQMQKEIYDDQRK